MAYAVNPSGRSWKQLIAQTAMTTGRQATPEEQAALREAELEATYKTQQGWDQLAYQREALAGDLAVRNRALDIQANQYGASNALKTQEMQALNRMQDKSLKAGNTAGIVQMGTTIGGKTFDYLSKPTGVAGANGQATGPSYLSQAWDWTKNQFSGGTQPGTAAFIPEGVTGLAPNLTQNALSTVSTEGMATGAYLGADFGAELAGYGMAPSSLGSNLSSLGPGNLDAFAPEIMGDTASATMTGAAEGMGAAIPIAGGALAAGMKLLGGGSPVEALATGVGVGAGAYYGAMLGTMILPGIGTILGGMLGSVAGSLFGGLFGNGGKHRHDQIPGIRAQGEQAKAQVTANRDKAIQGTKTTYATRPSQQLGRAVGTEQYAIEPTLKGVTEEQINAEANAQYSLIDQQIQAAIQRLYA